MFGYACSETDELMPITLQLSHQILEDISKKRKSGAIKWLRPDSKSQVTFEYERRNGELIPIRAHTILVSQQHDPDVTHEEIERVLKDEIKLIVPSK